MKKLIFIFFLLIAGWKIQAQPAGTVVAFAGAKSKIPTGWVLCDGKVYDRQKGAYKSLFDAIGTAWGGDGSNGFAVPDLRGIFLRGVSGETANDPEKDLRQVSNPKLAAQGNHGNDVGSIQLDIFEYHNHGFSDHGHRHRVAGGWSVNNGGAQPGGGELTNGALSRGDQYSTVDASNISFKPEGGAETRPKNANVYYIIKL